MFVLDGQIAFGVAVNGTEIPLTPGTLKALTVVQNRHQIVPTLEFGFLDQTDLVPKGILSDGAPLDVAMYPLYGDYNPAASRFLLHNIASINPTMAGHNVTLTGVLNQMPVFRKLIRKPYMDTAAGALSKIAGELGIPIETDSTDDKMAWMPNNRPIGQFMRHIVDHSFSDASSAMHLVFGGKGPDSWMMRFKDLNKSMQSGAVKTLASEGFPGDYSVLNYSARSLSGTLNSMMGYNSSVLQPSLEGKLEEFSSVTTGLASGSLNMSSLLKGALDLTRRELAPLDLGNTHKNFYQAKNQNQRIKATFTQAVTVMTSNYTNLQLLDPVDLRIYNGLTGELNAAISGKYLVGARSQHVQGSMYVESILLESQGSNSGGSGNVGAG